MSSKIGDKVQDILSGKIGSGDAGGLKITVPDTKDSILFAKEDGTNFADLEIRSNIDVSGNAYIGTDANNATYKLVIRGPQ